MAITRTAPLVAAIALLAAGEASAFPERLELDLGGSQRLSLVLVHAGSFREGSPAGEAGRGVDEGPRDVTVTRDFYLGEVPVLRGQFARFVAATGYRTEAETGRSGGHGFDGRGLSQRPEFNWRSPGFAQTDEHPAVILTYADASQFGAWATAQTGRVVRLPTEAEWELACRAGTTTPYYQGEGEDAARAAGWFRDGSGDGTRPVRLRAPNALGLHDMVGHVQQWVVDWYAPYDPAAAIDPLQLTPGSPPGEPARRVLRGGSWLRALDSGRCAARSRSTPGSRNADIGFRVAVDAEVPTAPPQRAETPAPSEGIARSFDAAPPSRDGDRTAALCCGAAAMILGALGVGAWIARRRGSLRAVQFVPQPDGFRVVAPPSFSGRTLRYRYSAGGQVHESAVTLEHSAAGQFVYTGAAPLGVEALGLGAAPSVGPTYTAPSDHYRSDTYSSTTSSPWSGRDPPAY